MQQKRPLKKGAQKRASHCIQFTDSCLETLLPDDCRSESIVTESSIAFLEYEDVADPYAEDYEAQYELTLSLWKIDENKTEGPIVWQLPMNGNDEEPELSYSKRKF